MPKTYEPIASVTLTGNQTGFDFTGIPQTYTDLVLIIDANTTVIVNGFIQFNSDASTLYSNVYLYGSGSGTASGRESTKTKSYFPDAYFITGKGIHIAHIMNYSNTTTYKTIITRENVREAFIFERTILYRSTSAITSINLTGGTFVTGSTFSLYGIKAA
jgi:hypothetical protein